MTQDKQLFKMADNSDFVVIEGNGTGNMMVYPVNKMIDLSSLQEVKKFWSKHFKDKCSRDAIFIENPYKK